jgi:hypothetical protein
MEGNLYFRSADSELCHSIDYFYDEMIENGITELEVYEAIPETVKDIFWCKAQCFCGDSGNDECGKDCRDYSPRNGKSGCCKHLTHKLYIHGDKVIINKR